MDCPRCEGSGQCVECKGVGSIVCPTCDGEGKKTSPRGIEFDCKSCAGSGKLQCSPLCSSCEGSGQITAQLQKKVLDKYTMRLDNTSALSKMCTWIALLSVVVFCLQQVPATRIWVDTWLLNTDDGWTGGQVWRLLAPIFMHGSVWHIGLNLYYLLSQGPTLEGLYGSRRFLFFYLLAGLSGNLFSWVGHCLVEPGPVAGIGASTSLFGVGAAFVALHYRWALFRGQEVQQSAMFLLGYMVLGFLGWFPGIDNWGHLGGFVAGFLFVYITPRPRGR